MRHIGRQVLHLLAHVAAMNTGPGRLDQASIPLQALGEEDRELLEKERVEPEDVVRGDRVHPDVLGLAAARQGRCRSRQPVPPPGEIRAASPERIGVTLEGRHVLALLFAQPLNTPARAQTRGRVVGEADDHGLQVVEGLADGDGVGPVEDQSTSSMAGSPRSSHRRL